MTELMREQLGDVRKDQDAWRAQAEANQRLVADARTRRGLFGWRANVSPTLKVNRVFWPFAGVSALTDAKGFWRT